MLEALTLGQAMLGRFAEQVSDGLCNSQLGQPRRGIRSLGPTFKVKDSEDSLSSQLSVESLQRYPYGSCSAKARRIGESTDSISVLQIDPDPDQVRVSCLATPSRMTTKGGCAGTATAAFAFERVQG